MIQDILVVLWKESKEVLQASSPRGRGRLSLLILLGVLGIFLPLQFGREMITSGTGLLLWGWVPMLLISAVVADSFAGERERHTLESLLATRLSDTAILLGKPVAATLYGYLITWSLVVLALLTINLTDPGEGLVLFTVPQFLAVAAIALLTSVLSGSLGVLVSLRAESVRQAQQSLSPMIFVFFIPLFALNFLPEAWQARVFTFISTAEAATLMLIAGGVLLVLDCVLVALSFQRFKRTRLITD